MMFFLQLSLSLCVSLHVYIHMCMLRGSHCWLPEKKKSEESESVLGG